jgi:mRNA deadenylase 3'-5' endonuclease subunit Ccr4
METIPRDQCMKHWKPGDFSVLSWNLLADVYLDGQIEAENADYSHVTNANADWVSSRWPLVQAEVTEATPDVACFQEVRAGIFDRDLKPFFDALGYEGLMVSGSHKAKWDEKNAPDLRVGVATFWARDAFELVDAVHRSRTMGVVLRGTSGHSVAMLNVHLEGNPKAPVARLRQLQKTLRDLEGKASHHGVVVAGDFNCLLGSSACSAFLAFGSVEPGVPEWGRPCPPEVVKVPPHAYMLAAAGGFRSAYDPSCAAGMTGVWSFGDEFTFCASPGGPVDGLDQIWATPTSLALVARRRLFRSDEHRTGILEGGLPSASEPSDHIPIGAVYRWTDGDKIDLKVAIAAAAIAASAPAALRSLEEVQAELDALLAACPFDRDADRIEYVELIDDLPGLPAKRRPTPEQIGVLKDRRSRKAAVTETLSSDAQQMLKRATTLAKEIKKRQQQLAVATADAKSDASTATPAAARAGADASDQSTSPTTSERGKPAEFSTAAASGTGE